jgi:hypothetical protein
MKSFRVTAILVMMGAPNMVSPSNQYLECTTTTLMCYRQSQDAKTYGFEYMPYAKE